MRLTFQQKRTLQLLRRFHERDPSVGGMLLANWPYYLATLVLLAGWSFLSLIGVAGPALTMVVGLVLGSIASDVGRNVARARIWPITRRITDWQEVDRLLTPDASHTRTDKA